MRYPFPPDIAKLIEQRMATGDYSSEDNLLRVALISLGGSVERPVERDQEYWDTVAAVQEGLADVEAGRVQPLAEVVEEFRRKFSHEKS